MKKLLFITDSLTNKISYYHIMLLLVALPFDQFYSHVIFISFALHTLIHLQRKKLKEVFSLRNMILQALFFITLLSFIYTTYPAAALTDITRQVMILLFPVFFSLTSLNIYKYRHQLLLVFATACTATVAYLYTHAFMVIRYFKLPVKAIISNAFISHNFSGPINMHATFFSMQIAIALFYIISQLMGQQSAKYRLFYTLMALLLFAGIIQLGSKAVLAAILLGINIVVPYFLIARSKRLSYILVTATLSVFVVAGALTASSLRERYLTDLKSDLSSVKLDEMTDPRLVRWEAAMQLGAKSPVIGYGAGSELSILREQFFKQKLYSSFLHRLNAHNQYISFFLTSGIIGLLVYLGTLVFGFGMAFRQKDMLFFIFMLLVAVVSLSESLLNAEKGVYFYSLFFSFFIFSGQHKSQPAWFKTL